MSDVRADDPRATLKAIVAQLSDASAALTITAQNTTNSSALLQILNASIAIKHASDQAAQALLAQDDDVFDHLAEQVRKQAAVLDGVETHLQRIINDVRTAATVIGFIAQAAAEIAKL